MRLVFAGTPDVALPSLVALTAAGHELVAVVTRPPAAQGRHRRLVPSPVQQWAAERGIEVLAPTSPRDPQFAQQLSALAPDCCPVVAYGGLIPADLLDLPAKGWINLHFSLLPAYRGAAPVQRAILDGATTTGATTFRIVEALDAGPIYGQLTVPVGPRTTSGELLAQLAEQGAGLLVEAVAAAAAGQMPRPQPSDNVSWAPKITVAEVEVDWQAPVDQIDRLIRAANPEPGAWTSVAGRRLVIRRAEPTDQTLPPGQIAITKKAVVVGTGSAGLRLLDVVPAGKRPMAAADWARGLPSAGPWRAGSDD
ncbi:MAG: methionyl-tRNA formyltransferase [Propionibacteriaceae bacterium]|jgi:methionyl-tRNA formyltransferase|nr:methionyl-tRNA formyltransferase [Propionibacteriaceae bacterium]